MTFEGKASYVWRQANEGKEEGREGGEWKEPIVQAK